jgi:hypothetical protein
VLREFYWGDDKIKKLATEYKDMGFYVSEHRDTGDPFIEVADNPDKDYYWKSPEHTGMFVRFREESVDRSRKGREKFEKWLDSDRDEIVVAHINTIVVASKDRGKGLSSKLIKKLIDVMSPDVIEVSDMSGGFWKRFESKHPEIVIWYEDTGE